MNVEKPYSKVKIVAHALATSQMLKQMAELPEFIKSLTQVKNRGHKKCFIGSVRGVYFKMTLTKNFLLDTTTNSRKY